MDIQTLDVENAASTPRDMKLLAPGGGDTGAILEVLGYDAPEVVEAARAFDREAMKDRKTDPFAREDARKVALARVAIVGWRGFEWEEQVKPFSQDFLNDLLSRPGFAWIADQVQEFGGDRANLFTTQQKA